MNAFPNALYENNLQPLVSKMNLLGKAFATVNLVSLISASSNPTGGTGVESVRVSVPSDSASESKSDDNNLSALNRGSDDALNSFYISHLQSEEYVRYFGHRVIHDDEYGRLIARLPQPMCFGASHEPLERIGSSDLPTHPSESLSTTEAPRSLLRGVLTDDGSSTTQEPTSTTEEATISGIVEVVPAISSSEEETTGATIFAVDYPFDDIPVDDYIVSTASRLDRIRADLELIKHAQHMRAALTTAFAPVNVALYILNMDVSRESRCDTRDCADFSSILEQTHYRMALIFYRSLVIETEGDVLAYPVERTRAELASLETVLNGLWLVAEARARMLHQPCRPMMRGLAGVIQSNADGGVNIHGVDVPPEVVDACCSCLWACVMSCIRRFTPTTTTTTTTTTPLLTTSTLSPAEIQRKEQLSQFMTSTAADIDNLLINVGMVSATSDSEIVEAMRTLRSEFMTKFAAITRGITANAPIGYDVTPVQTILLKLNDLYATNTSFAEWATLRKGIMQSINELRTEMYKLRAANV